MKSAGTGFPVKGDVVGGRSSILIWCLKNADVLLRMKTSQLIDENVSTGRGVTVAGDCSYIY